MGEFVDGKYHGSGYSNFNNILYFGNFNNGIYDDIGILFDNNILYKGSFKNGIKHGNGYEITLSNDSTDLNNNNIEDFLNYIEIDFETIINVNQSYITEYNNGILIHKKSKQDLEDAKVKISILELECNNMNIINEEYIKEITILKNNREILLCNLCVSEPVDTIIYPCKYVFNLLF